MALTFVERSDGAAPPIGSHVVNVGNRNVRLLSYLSPGAMVDLRTKLVGVQDDNSATMLWLTLLVYYLWADTDLLIEGASLAPDDLATAEPEAVEQLAVEFWTLLNARQTAALGIRLTALIEAVGAVQAGKVPANPTSPQGNA